MARRRHWSSVLLPVLALPALAGPAPGQAPAAARDAGARMERLADGGYAIPSRAPTSG